MSPAEMHTWNIFFIPKKCYMYLMYSPEFKCSLSRILMIFQNQWITHLLDGMTSNTKTTWTWTFSHFSHKTSSRRKVLPSSRYNLSLIYLLLTQEILRKILLLIKLAFVHTRRLVLLALWKDSMVYDRAA